MQSQKTAARRISYTGTACCQVNGCRQELRHPERGIVSRSTKGITNARQLLARDLFELKRVYPDIPNSALKELIDMNKKMYPEMRK